MFNKEIVESYGREETYQSACEKLTQMADIGEQCDRAGAHYHGDSNIITIDYLNRQYQIALPNCEVSLKDSDEQVPLRDKILILHYLTQAKGTPLTGKLISYKQVPGGVPYFARFSQLAVQPLLDHFGEKPDRLVPAAERMGGKKADNSDAAATISAFSRIPITIVLYRGDEEFPPNISVLFDSTIPDYLPGEDIRILCEVITWKLIELS